MDVELPDRGIAFSSSIVAHIDDIARHAGFNAEEFNDLDKETRLQIAARWLIARTRENVEALHQELARDQHG